MPTIIVQHDVQDFNTWQAMFQGHKATREQFGLTNPHVFRSAADPNHVCIIMEADSVPAFEDFMTKSDVADVMEKAGVIGDPSIRVLEAVEVAPTA